MALAESGVVERGHDYRPPPPGTAQAAPGLVWGDAALGRGRGGGAGAGGAWWKGGAGREESKGCAGGAGVVSGVNLMGLVLVRATLDRAM